MKFILGTIFFLSSLFVVSQNVDSDFLRQAEQYRTYKKELYIDFIPKSILPEVLKRNFYTDLSPLNFTKNIGQQTDSINKIHKLYLTTDKAGAGFITINRGGLDEMDSASSIVYIVDNETVETDKQASTLYGLKGNALKSVKYQLIAPDNTLIIRVQTEK